LRAPVSVKKRDHLEPIRYDELMGNAGMSGFVSFLIPSPAPANGNSGALPPPAVPEALRIRRKGRIRKALMVEDGHSLAEEAVYEALWNAALPTDGEATEDRTVRLGYHKLAQMTRLSWVSVKANLRSLEKKLAIEVTGSENSATREGKTYRVYSRAAILERRKKAGLEWVRRSRGVELLRTGGD
jgi:hypothetical protein